ncbi:MAG: N-acetylmuramoyl-L-alanine amidase [Flavobacteriales bacterium]|nr:N-acetylmuramoyl-L-alanine amidase [Flavobacteriales bacterium]
MVSGNTIPLEVGKISLNTIVIDAGHGGKDPGCLASDKITNEKEISLKIAKKLGKMLQDSIPGVKIIYTRNSDVFVPLWKRASIANEAKADLFISVHCNAHQETSLRGVETYIMGLHKNEGNLAVSKRENNAITLEDNYKDNSEYAGFDPNSDEGHIILSLYQNAYRSQSLKLAESIQTNVEKTKVSKNLGVKEAGFLVLWKTAMPSILVETGFLTNSTDKTYLVSETGQNKMATSIYKAVANYKATLEK